ncbi:hypothetical protein SERLA73DRAFT_149707 [Serpula lacrymans var. lacrymans S7.3]|uniref:Uncharacterized protein n=1 Tax=Serpula lacrymans var. lacrymans (strain S7.3) TaxID=936435 RepID=F8PIK9_SERL3|nr:hypothetical protein SERLA73DRAFT_149707 [Serpula lacrymans var. lacrymans S7.3]
MDDEAAILLSQLLTDSSHSRNKRIQDVPKTPKKRTRLRSFISKFSPRAADVPVQPVFDRSSQGDHQHAHAPRPPTKQPSLSSLSALGFDRTSRPSASIARKGSVDCLASFPPPPTSHPSAYSFPTSPTLASHPTPRPSFTSHRQAASRKDSGCEEDGVAEATPPALPPKPVPVGVHANGSAGEDGAAGEMAHLEAEDECGERDDAQGGEAFSSLMQTLPSTMPQAQTQTQTPPLARSKSMRSVKSVKSARSMRFGSKIPVPVPSPASTSTTGASASSGGVPEVPRIQRWLGAGEQEREHETTTFPLSPPPTPLSPSFSSYPPPSPLSPTSLASPTLPSWPHPKPSHAYSYHAESPRAKEQRQKQTSALGGFALSILKKRRRGPVVVVGEMGEGARDGG